MVSYSRRPCDRLQNSWDDNYTNDIWHVTDQENTQDIDNSVNRFRILFQVNRRMTNGLVRLMCFDLSFLTSKELKHLEIRNRRCYKTTRPGNPDQKRIPKLSGRFD